MAQIDFCGVWKFAYLERKKKYFYINLIMKI